MSLSEEDRREAERLANDLENFEEYYTVHVHRTFEFLRRLASQPAQVPMTGWISVKDRLPEFLPDKDYSANVLTTDGKTLEVFALCYEDGCLWGNCYGNIHGEPETDDDYSDRVTHWMPLPEPPTE